MSIVSYFRAAPALLATLSLTLAAPAWAQDQAQPAEGDAQAEAQPEISESHLEAARAAVDAIGATDEFDNILLNIATQTKAEFIPNNPNRQAEISEMVDEKALELASRRADLEAEVARVYARVFSEDELRQIAAFYGSEAGKKLIEKGPEATRESIAAARVWSNGIMRDLRQASIEGMNELFGEADDAGTAGTAEGEGASANQ